MEKSLIILIIYVLTNPVLFKGQFEQYIINGFKNTNENIEKEYEPVEYQIDIDSIQGVWKGTVYQVNKSHTMEYEIDSLGNETKQIKKVNTTTSKSFQISNTIMEIKGSTAKMNLYGRELFYDIYISAFGDITMHPAEEKDQDLCNVYYRSVEASSKTLTLIYFEFLSDAFWIEFVKK